ncbi:uncharacterized protein P884DRAFT_280069 [Thermothelomyces heterothallicus CBS 202.75]|uniref:uncharacterized protein n=1 Tax=Thermothelomyces heterothallicus CBS 202.75 TaxID=1149848 RepID=UPI003743B92E
MSPAAERGRALARLARVWLEFVLVNPLTHQEETKTPRRSNRSLYRAAWPVRTVLVSSTDAQSTTPGLLFYRFQESLQGQCSRNSDLFFPYALPFTSSHFHHHVFPILFLVVLGVVIKSYKHVCTVHTRLQVQMGRGTPGLLFLIPLHSPVSHPASLPPSLPSPLPPSEESRAPPGWGFGECFSKPSESGMRTPGHGQSGEPRPGLWWPGRRQGGGALASADAGPEKGTDSLRCIPVQPLQQREPSGTDISGLVANQWLRNSGRQQDANDGRDAGKDEGPRAATRGEKFAPSIKDCHDPSPGIVALRIIPAIEMEGGQMRAEPTVSYSDTVMIG